MYAIFVPVGVLMIVLAPFFLMITVLLMFFGISLIVLGGKRYAHANKAMGLSNPDRELPFYLRGGIFGLILIVRQVAQFSRELGLWFFMMVFGIGLVFAGGLILSLGEPPLYPGEKSSPAQPASSASPSAPAASGQAPAAPAAPKAPEVPRITGDAEIDRALADLSDDRMPINRDRGANALAHMPISAEHRAVVARKLAEVANADSFGQRAAAQTLALWATPNEIPVLVSLFRKGILRAQAARGLRTVGPAAEKDVIPLLEERDPFAQKDAVEVLAVIGTAQSLPALQALVGRRPAILRDSVQKAIAAIKARTQS